MCVWLGSLSLLTMPRREERDRSRPRHRRDRSYTPPHKVRRRAEREEEAKMPDVQDWIPSDADASSFRPSPAIPHGPPSILRLFTVPLRNAYPQPVVAWSQEEVDELIKRKTTRTRFTHEEEYGGGEACLESIPEAGRVVHSMEEKRLLVLLLFTPCLVYLFALADMVDQSVQTC